MLIDKVRICIFRVCFILTRLFKHNKSPIRVLDLQIINSFKSSAKQKVKQL